MCFIVVISFAFGILSQTLIIHMIRTSKVPFVESKSSKTERVNGTICLLILIGFLSYLIFFR